MKSKLRTLFFILPSIAIISVLFQNCSQPVAFETQAESTSDATAAGAVDDERANIPVEEVPTTNSMSYPKLKIEIQACAAGSLCEVTISASEPVQQEISGSWATNDSAWELQPDFYARPEYHYVPATGTFKIPSGQQSTVVRVTTISWDNQTDKAMTLNIPMSFFKCKYEQRDTPCSLFFK